MWNSTRFRRSLAVLGMTGKMLGMTGKMLAMTGAMLVIYAFISPVQAEEDFDKAEIQARITPVGNVRLEGTTGKPDSGKAVIAAKEADKAPGEATYEAHCVVCHAEGVAGAPKFRNAGDWQPRIAKANLNEMVNIATKGLNAMPPKGTCSECTEEELKNAIQFMLPKK